MSSPYQIVWIIVIAMTTTAVSFAQASVLEKESPSPVTNLNTTDDTQDVDVEINVDDLEEDALSENATQSVSTEGADDIDIDGIPQRGITVIIQNETVFVTRNPVTIDMTDELAPSIVDEIADLD